MSSPRTPPGRRVYAIGDIHGRADLLRVLLGKIQSDVATRAPATDVLLFLGDYIDRGPDSPAVLDLVGHPPEGFEAVRLLGNHESIMRDVLGGDREQLETWLSNGGDATLESYGIASDDLARLGPAVTGKIPKAHLDLLDSLIDCHVEGDYFFAHAGVRPGVPLNAQTRESLVWVREIFLSSQDDFGKVIVHGHSIGRQVTFRPNRIGIDTGAYRYGVLSAVVLDGAEQTVLQARDSEIST